MSDKLPIYMTTEDWVRAYEKQLPHWAKSQKHSPLAEQLLQMLEKESGNRILEIGVGNGRDCVFFAKHGNQVTGIDVATNAIDLARNNAKLASENEIVFSVGNAEKLNFNNASFDAVYSVSVLHATNLAVSLKEISRVLKSGGKALLYLYEKTLSNNKVYWFMKRSDVEALLAAAGLMILDKWNVVHTGHEDEKTTVLIYKTTKAPGNFGRL